VDRPEPTPASDKRVIHMVAEGASLSTTARVTRHSVSTVTRWVRSVGLHAQRLQKKVIVGVQAVEVQVDELRGYLEDREITTWVRSGIEVESRLWLTVKVGKRT
jgi:hypothetical protein